MHGSQTTLPTLMSLAYKSLLMAPIIQGVQTNLTLVILGGDKIGAEHFECTLPLMHVVL